MSHPSLIPSLLLFSGLMTLSAQVIPHGRPGGSSPNPGPTPQTTAAPDSRTYQPTPHGRPTVDGSPRVLGERRIPENIRVVPIAVESPSGRKVSTKIVLPPPMERFFQDPTLDDWRKRDVMARIMGFARHGSIPVKRIGDEVSLVDSSWLPAGWRGYGLVVPPHGAVKITLNHPNRGWFQLHVCNRWGSLEEGMLENAIQRPDPIGTYKNPSNKPRAVYFVVDDPGWMSSTEHPYTLTIERSWDPGSFKSALPAVEGIWAVHDAAPAGQKVAQASSAE